MLCSKALVVERTDARTDPRTDPGPRPTKLANGVFSNAVPLGAQLKAQNVFRASCAALKARTCLRCFETRAQRAR